jgi:hypothetical protein
VAVSGSETCRAVQMGPVDPRNATREIVACLRHRSLTNSLSGCFRLIVFCPSFSPSPREMSGLLCRGFWMNVLDRNSIVPLLLEMHSPTCLR